MLLSNSIGEYTDTVKSELGFNWEKLENYSKQTEIEIALPRSHPQKEYGENLWNYTVIRSDNNNFIEEIDSLFIIKDTVRNNLLKVRGTFSKFRYQSYQISQIGYVSQIDMSKSYPFPNEYPDSVKLFLLPGINIESDNYKIRSLIDSLDIPDDDMAKAALTIGTSNYITGIPYDEDDLSSVINGTTTTSWVNEVLSSAVETAVAEKAVCVEIARLQTAMCRAIGIPARTISWVNLHTWTEVWINGYGWLQMDKGYFPHYLPATLARLSSNSDNVWFDWTPDDRVLFSMHKVKMDNKPTNTDIKDTRIIIAKPTKLHLPLLYKEEMVGLIPIGFSYGLYFSKSDSSLSLTIINDTSFSDPKVSDACYLKTWKHSDLQKEFLEIDIEKLRLDAEIKKLGDWIILKVISINLKTAIKEISYKKRPKGLSMELNKYKNYGNFCIKIFNLKGKLVTKLETLRNKNSVYWNGENSDGKPSSSGLYIIAIYNNNQLLYSSMFNWMQ